jgi:hypothetical protein
MINSNDNDSQVSSLPGTSLAIFFLCCALLLPGKTDAQNKPTGDSFQIQQTLNQILGEDQAALYQKILSADQQISWEVYLPDNNSTKNRGLWCTSVHARPEKSILAGAVSWISRI